MMSFREPEPTRANTQMFRNRNLSGYATTSKKIGPVSMSLVLIMIVGVMALLYLTQITKTTVYGYQVSNLDTQRQALVAKNQELQVESARLQSVARVQDSPAAKSLQPQGQVSFAGNAAAN